MLIINAAVEQFCTLIDESLCLSDPTFLRMHHDDRLFAVSQIVGNELPEYVSVTRYELPTRHVSTALPQPELFKLIGNQRVDLPFRIIPFEDRVPFKDIDPALVERFMVAIIEIPPGLVMKVAARVAVELRPICSSCADVVGWDKRGIMHVVVTKRDPFGIDEPIGTNMVSGIGKHRARTTPQRS